MTGAPFNVLVYPYRRVGNDVFEYALLRRADAGFWQGVTGGGEDDETPLETARRETYEETGISPDSPFSQLDTVEPVRVTTFGCSHLWGEDIYVIPQYCFGVLAGDQEIVLSHEHTAYRWLRYAQADVSLKWDSSKTALWEPNQRLRGRGPRG
jgi:dATP pyrophosphohydrolase